jgi:putative peptide zinc metalloprotease protein
MAADPLKHSMSNRNRIFRGLVVIAAGLAIFAGLQAVPANAGDDNAAIAINTRDGSSVFSVRLSITRQNGDVVTASNAAIAYASCTDCQTTAIAFQAVLVNGSPSDFEPSNIAIALNVDCDHCTTFADAYQYVVQHYGQVRFTAAGSQQLAQIRRDLQALRTSDLSTDDLQARLDQLSQEFADVLANDVVVAGKSG